MRHPSQLFFGILSFLSFFSAPSTAGSIREVSNSLTVADPSAFLRMARRLLLFFRMFSFVDTLIFMIIPPFRLSGNPSNKLRSFCQLIRVLCISCKREFCPPSGQEHRFPKLLSACLSSFLFSFQSPLGVPYNTTVIGGCQGAENQGCWRGGKPTAPTPEEGA